MKNSKTPAPPAAPLNRFQLNKKKWTSLFFSLLISLCVLLVLVTVPLYAYKVWIKTDYSDFSVYYRAAQRVHAQQWDLLYNLADQASPLRYMPFFLPLLEPLALLERQTASVLWYGFQAGCFGGGFALLWFSLRTFLKPRRATQVTCLTFLMVLRLLLDTFTSGQISGLMFLGFALALFGWMHRAAWLTGLGLGIPTLIKIGPGIVYGIFLSSRWKLRKQGLQWTLLGLWTLFEITELWGWFALGSFQKIHHLWGEWSTIVAKDSVYYDSSHYGSQSINSVLLRLAHAGWMTPAQSQTLYLWSAILICSGILLFWFLRSPKTLEGKATFFCLGIFPYLWLMPETFKYTLVFLIFPISLLWVAATKSRGFTGFALLFTATTVSLAGKDLLPESLFFDLQKFSFPWMASVLLGCASFAQAWKESRWSKQATQALLFFSRPPILGPWDHLPPAERSLAWTLLLPLPLDSTSVVQHRNTLHTLKTLTELWKHQSHEILILPYGNRVSLQHPLIQAIQEIHSESILIRLENREVQHCDGQRGTALRFGFLMSRGQSILIGNLEQPLGIEFYSKALSQLEQGYDLVRGNRRHAASHFKIPIPLLPMIYKRHWMGMQWNRILRTLLPLNTTDTHSGHYAMTWKLAKQSFATQSFPGFLSDLELHLSSQAHRCKEIDIPVQVLLESEKSWSRILHETLEILKVLPLLVVKFQRGDYHPLPACSAISADDWGLSPGVNTGILQLAEQGIVRRVSLMANAAHLEDYLDALLQIKNIQLGIHFNLTYGTSLHHPQIQFPSSPGRMLWQWLDPRTPRAQKIEFICKELDAQLTRLAQVHVPIQYLDGHHHMHLLPGLFPHLLPILKKHGIQQTRIPYDRRLWLTPQAPVAFLAALAARSIRKSSLQVLPFVYPQAKHFSDPGRLRSLLRQQPHAEIIVHPAAFNDLQTLQQPEPYQDGRIQEFRALQMLTVNPS